MFKRANKITSLLVAAAAVASMVPAYAADVKKVDSEDGTIYNAVAYKDGEAYIDGEINDEEAAYYLADGKYNALDDVDSGDTATLFGEKYLDIEDGDYTVDLSTGKVTDDDVQGDTADDAASALRKAIKDDTDDRYDEDATDDIKDEDSLDIIPGLKYAAPWYATTYTQATGSTANNNNTAVTAAQKTLNVFTDTDGNYIDADYNLGKIKVTTTSAGSNSSETVEVKNTDDTYDTADNEDALTVSVAQEKVLTQDSDYIYRLVTVTVKTSDSTGISKINGVSLSGATAFTGADTSTVTFKAVQKISKKASSSDVDGANYANTVTTYALADDSGDTVDDNTLFTATNTEFTLVGGKIVFYNNDTDETVNVRAYTLKSSNGFYYADSEDDADEDCENSEDQGNAVQTDVDGNLWVLNGGYIYKFDGTDGWDKVYKVDGSEDEFTVYDADNMISWSEDDETYSIVGGTSSTDEDTTATDEDTTGTETTTTAAAGWAKNTDGTWSYNKADGTKATGWLQDGTTWYYLNANGVMATGWQNVGTTWYYLNASGAMQTGWINDNGTWYYCNASGAMLTNTTVDGYVLGANGAWVK